MPDAFARALPRPAIDFPKRLGVRTTNTRTAIMFPNGSNVPGYLIVVCVSRGSGAGVALNGAPGIWTTLFSEGAADGYAFATWHIVTGTEGWDGVDDSVAITGADDIAAHVVTYRRHGGNVLAARATGSSGTIVFPSLSVAERMGRGPHEWLTLAMRYREPVPGVSSRYTLLASTTTGAALPNQRTANTVAYRDRLISLETPAPVTHTSCNWFAGVIAVRADRRKA